MKISCKFSRLIFSDDKTDFDICIYIASEKEKENLKFLPTLSFYAKGYGLPLNKHVEINLEGDFKNEKGRTTFIVTSYNIANPEDKDGILAYLSSGIIKGVGRRTAMKIYKAFGNRTFQILDRNPEKLYDVRGFSRKKADKIIDAYKLSFGSRDTVLHLSKYGIPASKAVKAYKKLGKNTYDIIKNEPFILYTCGLKIPFNTINRISKDSGCNPQSKARIYAGFIEVLLKNSLSGNLYMEQSVFLNESTKLLSIDRTKVEAIFTDAISTGVLKKTASFIYLPAFYFSEIATAKNIARLLKCDKNNALMNENQIDKKITDFEKENGLKLAETQISAIKTSFSKPVSIITGGPGTGKTTIVKAIIDIYKASGNNNESILLLAPTGKAARRLSETTNLPASTIHSALELGIEEDYDDSSIEISSDMQLKQDLIIIDEFSMVDQRTSSQLFKKIKTGARVIIVGDKDQLPSVGAGNVLSELLEATLIPSTKLEVIFRQSEGSVIVKNAIAINGGNTDLEYTNDFKLFEMQDPEVIENTLVRCYEAAIKAVGIENVSLLTPLRKSGINGYKICTENLNTVLQSRINPPDKSKAEFKFGNRIYRVGDRIIQLKNIKDVANGDIGTILDIYDAIDEDSDEDVQKPERIIKINFSGVIKEYKKEDMENVELAYATTIHKSQGSESSVVIMGLTSSEHKVMLQRNLLYTAVTRAKKKVIIVGDEKAISYATKNNKISNRASILAQRTQYFIKKNRA